MTGILRSTFTRYGQSLYYLLSNRREFDRIPLAGSISITYENGEGAFVSLICRCIDGSPGGLGLCSPEEIPAGAEICLSAGKNREQHLARVQYCEPEHDFYRVGIKLSASPSQ